MERSNNERRRYLTQGEIADLVREARASGHRDYLLVALSLDTGLPLGEVARLRGSSLLGDQLLVEGKRGLRYVPVSEEIARGLESLAQGDDGIWRGRSGGPMTAAALGGVYRRLFHRAGIQGARAGVTTLRHTFALEYIRHGGSPLTLMHRLGHRRLYPTGMFAEEGD